MKIDNDIAVQSALERSVGQNDAAQTRKVETADKTSARANRATPENEAAAKTFAANAAKLSASEFYAQAKLFFSQSAEAGTLAENAAQTAEKLTALVFDAADDEENLLKSAKSGFLDGFDKAAQNWGGALPQIVNQTLDRAIETIDFRLHSLGFPLLNMIA
ncbi:MAG: hypothetical protein LBF86_03445 [Helicobacteraceae bacterium]|jgi:FAD/FMN-containing dehydrogenase|nr:hypothetical protein [Helicobacteraceae bacterium]